MVAMVINWIRHDVTHVTQIQGLNDNFRQVDNRLPESSSMTSHILTDDVMNRTSGPRLSHLNNTKRLFDDVSMFTKVESNTSHLRVSQQSNTSHVRVSQQDTEVNDDNLLPDASQSNHTLGTNKTFNLVVTQRGNHMNNHGSLLESLLCLCDFVTPEGVGVVYLIHNNVKGTRYVLGL